MKDKDPVIISLNLSTVLSCFISAIGYGIGYAIPDFYGYSPIVCLIVCFAAGILFDFLSDKLFESKVFTSSKRNMIGLTIGIYALYFIISYLVSNKLNYEIDEEFLIDLGFLTLFNMFSFVFNYFKNTFFKKKH